MSQKDREEFRQPRFVGSDQMFTVYRTERRGSNLGPPAPPLPFRDEMLGRLLTVQSELMEDDWPPFGVRVEVGEDGNSWRELPAALAEELEAQGFPPQLEVAWEWHLGEAPVLRFEYGMNFIIRRVEPLTREYWLIQEVGSIRRFLDAPYPDSAARAAFELGRLTEQARLHTLHLPNVIYGGVTKRERREGGKKSAHPDQARIINAMRTRISRGQSIQQAALAAHSNDRLGSSGPANKKIWKRYHARQKRGRSY